MVSRGGGLSNETKTAAVCPSETGTRTDHVRPGLEGAARAGDRLIGRDEDFSQAVLAQGRERGNIALDRAVRLDGDEAPGGAEPLLLARDDVEVRRVDFGDHHRDVAAPAVRGVVRDHGDLRLGVALLEGEDVGFRHVDRTEDEVDGVGDLFDLGGVEDGEVLHGFGDRGLHFPAARDGFLIGHSGGTGGRGRGGDFKIGMVFKEGQEPLTDHAGRADDCAFQLACQGRYLR